MTEEFLSYEKLFVNKDITNTNRMDDLTFRIFENTDEGKEFLSLLRDAFYSVRLLPTPGDRMSKYGSLESYLAYHEGQRSIVSLIEASIAVMKSKMKGLDDE